MAICQGVNDRGVELPNDFPGHALGAQSPCQKEA
jgi:hypothetical protein